MENIHRSRYCEMNWEPQARVFEVIWLPESSEMEAQEYKAIMLRVAEHLRANPDPLNMLADNKHLAFSITPDLQEWVLANVLVHATKGRAAIVLSEEIFTQVSLEQVLDDHTDKAYELRYFDSVEEARKWFS